MRSAPAIRVDVTRFGVWRWGLGLCFAAACTSLAAWIGLTRLRAGEGLLLWAAAGIGALALASAVTALLGRQSFCLSFDGTRWSLSFPDRASASGGADGRVRVALDAGIWMLLRFEPASPGAGGRTAWLPIQRAGLEADWHALRSAVYSARLAPAPVSDPPRPP